MEPLSTTEIIGGIIAIIGGVVLFIQNHQTKKEAKNTNTSLTTNNGGSTVKDRLDNMDKRLYRIEGLLMGKKVDGE